jgi:hypothetical protein
MTAVIIKPSAIQHIALRLAARKPSVSFIRFLPFAGAVESPGAIGNCF